MAISTQLSKPLLLLLTVTGGLAAWAFLFENGLIRMLHANYYSKQPRLPTAGAGSAASIVSGAEGFGLTPMQTKLTGYDEFDKSMATMVAFFWPALDGGKPGMSALGIHFFVSPFVKLAS